MNDKTTVKGYTRSDGVAVRSHDRKKRVMRNAPEIIDDDATLRDRQHAAIVQMADEDQIVGRPESSRDKMVRRARFSIEGVGWTTVHVGLRKFRNAPDEEIYVAPNGDYDGLELEDINLIGAKLSNGSFRKTRLRNANLNEADLSGSDMKRVSLSGANLVRANLSKADLSDANLTNANLNDADLRGVILDGASLDNTSMRGVKWEGAIVRDIFISQRREWADQGGLYEKCTFKDAADRFGLSDKQFEFMVLSGAIEVRDNTTLRVVKSQFNPEQHHVPPWVMANFTAR